MLNPDDWFPSMSGATGQLAVCFILMFHIRPHVHLVHPVFLASHPKHLRSALTSMSQASFIVCANCAVATRHAEGRRTPGMPGRIIPSRFSQQLLEYSITDVPCWARNAQLVTLEGSQSQSHRYSNLMMSVSPSALLRFLPPYHPPYVIRHHVRYVKSDETSPHSCLFYRQTEEASSWE